jgi:hypothetical protein
MMALLDKGWTEEQAQALLDSLNLVGGIPNWKPEHLQKLRDWCSAHEMDYTAIEGQLEFIAFELCNSYESIGAALKLAKTLEGAKEAVEPYVKALTTRTRGPQFPRLGTR